MLESHLTVGQHTFWLCLDTDHKAMFRWVAHLSLTALLFLSTSALAGPQQNVPGEKPAARMMPAPAQAQTASRPAKPTPVAPVVQQNTAAGGLEHVPSSPPEVSFQGGKLTIVARNSTLGDVLNAVKQKTGAVVDMPGAASERVVGQFGPGAPRDVMAQLLNGSHFDYVLVGSPADPTGLKKIVLMAKVTGPEPPPAQAQMNQPPQAYQNLQAVPEVESENPDENNGEATPNMGQPPDEEAQPDQPADQGDNPPNGPVIKTPEQLLRELQQQQQQQQQQQDQSGPPGAPGQPPQ